MSTFSPVDVRTPQEWLVSRPPTEDLDEARMICVAAVRSLLWTAEARRYGRLPETTVDALADIVMRLEGDGSDRAAVEGGLQIPRAVSVDRAVLVLEKSVTAMDVLAGVGLLTALIAIAAGGPLGFTAFQSSILSYVSGAVGLESFIMGLLLRRHRLLAQKRK